jgi:hypothetical protein
VNQKTSRFDDLFASRSARAPQAPTATPLEPVMSVPRQGADTELTTPEDKPPMLQTSRPRGRPCGLSKRSNPEYEPLTVYIRTTTRRAVNLRIATLRRRRQLSDIVDNLLARWGKGDLHDQ